MQARPAPPCAVCLSVCVFVTFVHSVKTNKHMFKIFLPSSSHTIPVFPYQTAWQYSDGTPLTGMWNAGGVGHSEPISGSIACCEPFQRQVQLAATDHGEFITLVAGKRPGLLMAGNNDEVLTRSLNVTPKTTLRSGKSQA